MIKTPFNLIISGINAVTSAINSISVKVPDWVPIIGGKEFGFDIPEIPKFAEGGVVGQTGIALVHEGEVILPAEKLAGANAAVDKVTPSAETLKPEGADLPGRSFMKFWPEVFDDSFTETPEPAENVPVTALMSKIDELIAAVNNSGTTTAAVGGQKEVVLEVSGKRLGKVVYEDYIRDRLQPIIDTGG